MRKKIEHLLTKNWCDTLCWYDIELCDEEWVPHDVDTSQYPEQDIHKRPIPDWFSYEELWKFEFEDKFICRRCIDELNNLMKQYTNLLNA